MADESESIFSWTLIALICWDARVFEREDEDDNDDVKALV